MIAGITTLRVSVILFCCHNPASLYIREFPRSEKEREIYINQSAVKGKPKNAVERHLNPLVAERRLNTVVLGERNRPEQARVKTDRIGTTSLSQIAGKSNWASEITVIRAKLRPLEGAW